MANNVKFKRSSVAGKVPLTTDLELGQLALNTYDGKIYLKKSVAGVETIVAVQQVSAGTGVTFDTTTGVISIGQDIGTTASPTFNNLTVTTITDSLTSVGTDGQVLQSTGTGIKWASPGAASGAVVYTANQGLSSTQQQYARDNISAIAFEDFFAYGMMLF